MIRLAINLLQRAGTFAKDSGRDHAAGLLPVKGEREGADLGGGTSLELQPNSRKVLARLMGNPPQLASREAPVSQEGPRVPTRLSPWLEQPLGSGVLVGTWWVHSVMLPTANNLSSTLPWLP